MITFQGIRGDQDKGSNGPDVQTSSGRKIVPLQDFTIKTRKGDTNSDYEGPLEKMLQQGIV